MKTPKIALAEIIGTGILGGIAAYPIARFLIRKDVATFFFVYPFLISTLVGSLIAYFLLQVLGQAEIFTAFRQRGDVA